MASLSPQQIALLIVALATLVGLVADIVRRQRLFAGFEEQAQEIRKLAKSISGEVRRDGEDVEIVGSVKKRPVTIRFSNDDYMPGLSISQEVPATFSLYIASVSLPVPTGGRTAIRTGDTLFDSRFATRTDHPMEAKLFVTPQSVGILRQLCCSGNTRLRLTERQLQLTEAAIPNDLKTHVSLHLKQVQELSAELAQMPGAHEIKLSVLTRKRHLVRRSAMGIGAVAAIVLLFGGGAVQKDSAPTVVENQSGVLPIDARVISNLKDWRVATADDFDPIMLHWMKENDIPAAGRMRADFSGKANAIDVAYLLVGKDGTRRVVMLSDGRVRYDGQFDSLGGVVLLPKSDIDSVDWVTSPPEKTDGDGLLVIRKPNDPSSDFALFRKNGTLVFAKPAKYDNISVLR